MPTLQLLIHLALYGLGFYLLIRVFFPKKRKPADCLAERSLKLASDDLLQDAEFRIMYSSPMRPRELNAFFSSFSQYFVRCDS